MIGLRKRQQRNKTSAILTPVWLSLLVLLSACGGAKNNSDEAPSVIESVEKTLARATNTNCVAPVNASAVATQLSNTGCFSDIATRTPASGVIPYTVNNLLWSDGENKGRYFAIPDNSKIKLITDEPSIVGTNGLKNANFFFPSGSVIIKHFFNGDRVIETRLLMNHASADGWVGYSYEWNAEQSEATLLTAAKQIVTPVSHSFPSPAQCMECHTDAALVALGPDSLQLSYSLNYTDGSRENFLDALDRLGYFETSPLSEHRQTRLYAINDSSATLEQRARSYLHSNCSGCHRERAPQGGFGDMRYNAVLANNLCGVAPSVIGSPGTALIEPGDAQNSTIYRRINSNGGIRMPPIGRASVDTEAVQVMGEWINSLTSCQ